MQAYPPPTLFAIGAALRLWAKGPHRIEGAFQLNHPNDNAENLRIGVEYAYSRLLYVRVGQKLGLTDQYVPVVGMGLSWGWGRGRLSLNYAAEWMGRLGLQHRIGLLWQKEVLSSSSSPS